jgi:hypothetical protein
LALTVIIQNMNHTEVARYSDDPDETLYRLCSARPKTSLVRGIHRHADTMFNTYQLGLILDEVEAMSAQSDIQQRALDELRRAATTAIRERGYILFIGD